ncbi:MAG TPA: hypothetical protein V6C89_10110 [Drouetiella sp.]
MQTAKKDSKQSIWKTMLSSRLLKAFLIPFLVAGILFAYMFGANKYKEITEYHPEQYPNFTKDDATKAAWDAAFTAGIMAGLFSGIACFGVCLSFRKSTPRDSEQ